MKKVLYLYASDSNETIYFANERNKVDGVNCLPLYKKKGIINKLILGVGYYFFPSLLYLIYYNWKKEIDAYDVIILPSRRASKYAVKYIKKKTNKRVIVWYWNIVTKRELSPDYCRKNGCEVWSFDKKDCKKYNMKFGDTYYFDLGLSSDNQNYSSDLFFIGVDKQDRIESMNKLNEYCIEHGIIADLNLTINPEIHPNKEYSYSPRMTYDEVLKHIQNSKAILDLNQPNQSGLTLRPLEALLLKKKLITNNKYITELKAYDKNNTFILNGVNFEGLAEFLKAPYVNNDTDLFEFYKFEKWLYRICNNIEAY